MTDLSPRPFRIDIPDATLDLIRARLLLSRDGYAPADDKGWAYGTDAGWLAGLRRYWLDTYDWRAAERHLNRLPHFKACINGIDIHFIHLRGDGSRLPLILTHGWPGSCFEFDQVAEPLAALGFDVVIPSLPGFAFSSRPDGIVGPRHVAGLWRRLMVDVLGYPRFGAQGGDWGSAVTTWLGRDHGDVVASIHLNLFLGPTDPADTDPETLVWRQRLMAVQQSQSAYMMEQATKPQTIGLALADSPLGFASWIMEKFHGWADTKGDIDGRFSKDQLLTNLMLYLVNDAVQSSIWIYRSMFTEPRSGARVEVPTGCALFPAEFLPYPPRSVAARCYNITRWTEMAAGGHFAAMEEPVAFTREIAEFFKDF
ncbi:epoxide hydrolase family protein [Niveispirillum sp.]|uniref:epoxide hydrolase family protein n=1 Tax=Niveispirillum sp. TaxID=1917217 RepID=UPI001B711C02|nr:epoxide hydrolase family protein [Niveispirillum sp.]MBP7334187.1 epoxide hydrolase [Niveispirillum sp.]